MPRIERSEGRRLFGSDPAAYDSARPGHAERVYEILVERCGLRPGTAVLEIGPGTGQATRRLLALGANPLVAIEPDRALAAYLEKSLGNRIELLIAPLEDAQLSAETFDLAVAASSFHWVDETLGLARVLAALRPGGWWAMWWTLFGDSDKPDPFFYGDQPVAPGPACKPDRGRRRATSVCPRQRREARRSRGGRVQRHCARARSLENELGHTWHSCALRHVLPDRAARREAQSDDLGRRRANREEEFAGRVERTLLTSIYTARRPVSRER